MISNELEYQWLKEQVLVFLEKRKCPDQEGVWHLTPDFIAIFVHYGQAPHLIFTDKPQSSELIGAFLNQTLTPKKIPYVAIFASILREGPALCEIIIFACTEHAHLAYVIPLAPPHFAWARDHANPYELLAPYDLDVLDKPAWLALSPFSHIQWDKMEKQEQPKERGH